MSKPNGHVVPQVINLGGLHGNRGLHTADLLAASGRVTELPPPTVQPRHHVRKVALIGSAQSVDFAPWFDPSWEIWAHATCHTICRRADRYFDVHPWPWIASKGSPDYLEWLRTNRIPIYMEEAFPKVPAAVRYPAERICAEFPHYFSSHTAWMMALALTEGVSHVGLFGIHYSVGIEYVEQRPGAEFWCGVAVGRGVQLVIPPTSPLCHEPKELYGYESHHGDGADRRRAIREGNRQARVPTPIMPITVEESILTQRDDMESDKHVQNSLRMAQGLPALLPNGQPAW